MLYWLIPLIIGVILLGVFLFFRVKERRVIAVIIKGFVSLMFIATALVAWLTSNNPHTTFGIFVLCGLFFGLLGDVFLDLKYIARNELLFTILGFFAFAFGHICYISGLFIHFFDFNASIFYIIIPAAIAVLLTVVTLLMEKFLPIRYGKMKPFVVIYGACLFFATAIYWSATIQYRFNILTLVMMSVGLVLFMASDLILNNTYFAKGYNGPVYIVTNHVLYYVAQFLVATSLFFLI